MHTCTALAALTFMAPLAACQLSSPEVGKLSQEDVEAIEQLVDQRAAVIHARDWEPWWAIYEKDALFIPPWGSPITLRDWTATQEPADLNMVEYSAEIEEIDGCGDLAYLRARYVEVMSSTEGVEPHPHPGTFVWLLRKRADGSWRVFMTMFNSEEL
jgi:ketosteroid isomerase-like protein